MIFHLRVLHLLAIFLTCKISELYITFDLLNSTLIKTYYNKLLKYILINTIPNLNLNAIVNDLSSTCIYKFLVILIF